MNYVPINVDSWAIESLCIKMKEYGHPALFDNTAAMQLLHAKCIKASKAITRPIRWWGCVVETEYWWAVWWEEKSVIRPALAMRRWECVSALASHYIFTCKGNLLEEHTQVHSHKHKDVHLVPRWQRLHAVSIQLSCKFHPVFLILQNSSLHVTFTCTNWW